MTIRSLRAPKQGRGTGRQHHVGSYTLNAGQHQLTVRIEHASLPHWDGAVQQRTLNLHDDRLIYTAPTPTSSSGGGASATGEVEWRRQR